MSSHIFNPCVTEIRAKRCARTARLNIERATAPFDGCKTLRTDSDRLGACSETPAWRRARGRVIGGEPVSAYKRYSPIPSTACSDEKGSTARRQIPTSGPGGTSCNTSHAGSWGDWACTARARRENDIFAFFDDLQHNTQLLKTEACEPSPTCSKNAETSDADTCKCGHMFKKRGHMFKKCGDQAQHVQKNAVTRTHMGHS